MNYKASSIAKWFLAKNKSESIEHEATGDDYEVYEGITHLKLQKLLFYAQGIYLALNDNMLFYDQIVAWEHGPVVKSVYDEYKQNGRNPINIELNPKNNKTMNICQEKSSRKLRKTY